ncbi:MAG: CHAD domain-containing protein [Chloroflexota bacterium]|nr:MAG: CHAD domain-containing protein [Chloroflexota bacterium]
MGTLLNAADKAQIEDQEENGTSAAIRRRAKLLLLYDQGLPTRDVAVQVDLSESRTRYWRRRFVSEGMQIFAENQANSNQASLDQVAEEMPSDRATPDNSPVEDDSAAAEVLEGNEEDEQVSLETDRDQVEEPETKPISLDELCQRYPTNLRRAEHRRDLALRLFDATQSIHQLPDENRRLLEVAALLQYLTENEADGRKNKSGYLFILSHPLTDLSDQDNKIVEEILGSLHGKAPRAVSTGLEDGGNQSAPEALVLAALLRMASGLDASQTQSTNIQAVELTPEWMVVRLEGTRAKKDARKASKLAKLWKELFAQKVRFQVVYQLEQAGDERLETLLSMERPGVETADSLSEAGRKVMGFHFAQMILHEAGTRLGEDIEELHDMRVATRRMRAAFEVFQDAFEPKAVKKHLKGLRATGRALGRVRDLDVFVEKAGQYLETLPQEQRNGLEPLLELWRNERETDRVKMLEYLDSEDYTDFKQTFLEFVTTPGEGAIPVNETTPNLVRHVVPVLIYTRFAAVRAYGLILESATIEQLHSLRIEFKKLRYTLEFFREVLGEEVKDLIDEIKSLQDHLGDLNDADVACSILRNFLDEWESRQFYKPISERENPEPVVAYLASKHAERYFLTTNFQGIWSGFDQAEIRAKFASAVSVL